MIKEKDIEQCRFFTTTGGDIWKIKKLRTITEVDLINCETTRVETCRVGEQSAEKFIPINIPIVTHRGRPAVPRKKRLGRSPKKRKISPAGQAPAKGSGDKRSVKKGKKTSSQYLGVTAHQNKKKIVYYAQSTRGGNWKNLGVHNVEELAAAAVQEYLGNDAEAKRLREIAAQKTVTAIKQLKGNVGQVKFLCAGCGADYEQKPEKCTKCGSGAFETIQPEAKRKK